MDILSLFYINQFLSNLAKKPEIWYYCLPNRYVQFIMTTEKWNPKELLRDIVKHKAQDTFLLSREIINKMSMSMDDDTFFCEKTKQEIYKIISILIARGNVELMQIIFSFSECEYDRTKSDSYLKKAEQYYLFLLEEIANPSMQFNCFRIMQKAKKYQWQWDEKWMIQGILNQDKLCLEYFENHMLEYSKETIQFVTNYLYSQL